MRAAYRGQINRVILKIHSKNTSKFIEGATWPEENKFISKHCTEIFQ